MPPWCTLVGFKPSASTCMRSIVSSWKELKTTELPHGAGEYAVCDVVKGERSLPSDFISHISPSACRASTFPNGIDAT